MRRGVVPALVAGVLALPACSAHAGRFQVPQLINFAPNVVHENGIGRIPFGAHQDELIRQHLIVKTGPGCDGQPMYDIPEHPDDVDLIFDKGKLLLIWVYSPDVQTPKHLGVLSHIDRVRDAYPAAEELAGSDRSYPGLLTASGDTGILFLYDPASGQVIKMLAGMTNVLRSGHRYGISC